MLRSEWFNTDAVIELAWIGAWQVAAVAVLVAVVTAIFCRRRPHLAYLLWLLVLVKAITPPLWSSPTGAFSWALAERVRVVLPTAAPLTPPAPSPLAIEFNESTRPAQAPADPMPENPPVVGAIPSAGSALTLNDALLIGWATGTVGLGVWLTANWLLLARRIRRTSELSGGPLAEQFATVKQRIGLRRPVKLRVTSESLGPAALGWWRGTVLVPDRVLEQSASAELDAIFAHELVHLRRFDPLVGSLQLAVQFVWWWHPAVWWANRQVRVERERSCDEAVLAQVDVRPTDYARLLVELLRSRRSPVPAVFWSGMRSSSATAARVRHVLETKSFRRRSPLAAWLIAAVLLAIVLPGAGSRFITAAPPEEAAAEASGSRDENQPASTEVPIAPASESANRKQSPDEAAAFQKLSDLGAIWGTSGNAERRWAVTLPNSFDPGDSQLPLAALSRVLMGVSIGGQGPMGPPIPAARLRAQILSLRELPADVSLNVLYTSENASALDSLLAIPNLTHLSLFCNGPAVDWANAKTRPFALSDLKRLTSLALSAADGDLPEIARLTELEQLGLMGSASSAAVNDLKSLTRLKSLTLHELGSSGVGASVAPLDLACLDELKNLERLYIGGLLNDAAAKRIGTLANLHDLSISVDGLSDAGLVAIAKAASLHTVHLSVGSSPGVSARGFAALGALKNLDRLSILGWAPSGEQPLELTDESVAGWDRLANLRFLVISHCSIGDAGVRRLSSLPILYCLQLEGPLQVTDAGVAELKNSPELGALVLTGSKITGSGLAPLKDCKSLSLINLSGSPLTDAGLEALATVKLLSQLDVSGTKVTDKGLAALIARVPWLSRLNLARTATTDDGLSSLKGRDRLQQLNLADTKVTIAGIGQLLDANRQLMIWSIDPQTPQTRAFEPGTYQGAFQPIDANEVLAGLLTAKTAKADTAAFEPEDVTFIFAPAAVAEEVDEPEEAEDGQPNTANVPHESQDAINQLRKLGLRVTPVDVGGQQKLYADFDPSFQPLGEPLPLAELPKLEQIAIGDRLDLNEEQLAARLRAVRNLRTETNLVVFLQPDQGAVFDLLAEIPNLERLGVMSELPTFGGKTGRKITLAQLKGLRELSLVGTFTDASLAELAPLDQLEILQLYQAKPFAKLDLACLENKPRLRRLITGGIEPTDEGFARIGKLPALEHLMTDFTSATDAGMSQLAKLSNLKTLALSSSQEPSRVTPEGMAAIGKLTQLVNLTISGKFSRGNATAEAGVSDRIVAGWSPQLKQLKSLHLFNCRLGDAGLGELRKLPALMRLNLSGELEITDDGMAHLGTMTTLKHLSLANAAITDEGLSRLKGLTGLESLVFYNAPQAQVSDSGLARLAGFSKLEKLVITNAKVQGRGLAPFTTLTSLSLENNPVDDAGVEVLVRNKQLTDLNLSGSKITDKSFSVIAENLPDLKRLNVRQTQLTDAGLEALKPLAHLYEVRAAGTQITQAGKDSLKSVVDFGNNFVVDGELEIFSLEVD